MDFYRVCTRETKNGVIEVYPDFIVGRSQDLMVRGRSFYAIWDEQAGLWSTDEYDVQRIVDRDLQIKAAELEADGRTVSVKYMKSFRSNSWSEFRSFMNQVSDNAKQLDQVLAFADSDIKKTDYVSRRLPYALPDRGNPQAWDELVGTLYSPDERRKLEWAIGSIVAGEAKEIQKFVVLYGSAGTGKSTVLDIIQQLFEGYTTTFDAKALGGNSNAFATEVFKSNPLVAIQHDGDLSRITDNTKLNSIVSHEDMTMNEKYKPSYTARVNAFLFIGTNQPVKISDAKSGLIRRLIDVHPTGAQIPPARYFDLIKRVKFELGEIARHCLDVYLETGKNYYSNYRPLEMMFQTDVFFNFVEDNYGLFKRQDGVSLKQAYILYKEYCNDTGVEKILPQYRVREELRNYFDIFHERAEVDGKTIRSYYSGFDTSPFNKRDRERQQVIIPKLKLEAEESLLDELYSDQPAQYAKENGTPKTFWVEVTTTLADLDTSKLHYVKVPPKHIVIDFDLTDPSGEKSLDRNIRAASSWPPTYTELSKSGSGLHLHYIYEGPDFEDLMSVFDEGIEIKKFSGGSSLRRKFTLGNDLPVATLKGGLPTKERKLTPETMQNEKSVRDLILRNLRKEIHAGTKPSVDFIKKILDDAYDSGMHYDVTDLRSTIMAFAANSSNQAQAALQTVQKMKFKSETEDDGEMDAADERLVFFDVEVYPNLFVVCWKYEDADHTTKMVNPSPAEVEDLLRLRLVGFNNRRYDNHILYGRVLGANNEQLYALSQRIINRSPGAMYGEAYGISYADIYDFSSKKQTLKKFQVELGLKHQEMDLPWDEPVDKELWDKVVDYCVNDVISTEATFKDRYQDFVARQILADLSGLRVNDTTQKHTAKIIFGNDPNPKREFVYTDLSKEFPGYEFDHGKSSYRGEITGEGGYVYAEPGIYRDVALLDVASMHPASIEALNLFGDYTEKFSELKQARLAIKHGEFDKAREMLDGKLAPYLEDTSDADALSYALKIVINIVYGLTSARFDNPFRDQRNKDNIVAKRGALFMVDLKNYIQDQGFQVVHVKTDSVKIPGATPELIEHIHIFGEEYGYEFEHEATYDVLCLVNDAVYVARERDKWVTVGAQFQHPYIFKMLFSGDPIEFADLCETRSVVKGAMWLDFDKSQLPIGLAPRPGGKKFVGRTGLFVPVTQESGGAVLLRINEGKEYAVTGTKGYLWLEADMVKHYQDQGDVIEVDMAYFDELEKKARAAIQKYGRLEDLYE